MVDDLQSADGAVLPDGHRQRLSLQGIRHPAGQQRDQHSQPRPEKGAILYADSYFVGSSESGQIAVHPDDPTIIFSGAIGSSAGGGDALHRYDHKTGQSKIVSVWPEFVYGQGVEDHRYRFQWTYPIVFSPHDSGTLYVAAEVVFRSTNEGHSWEPISPDLTRNDRTKMEPSGGPITKDTTFVENFGTIFAFVESPHEQGCTGPVRTTASCIFPVTADRTGKTLPRPTCRSGPP